MQRNASVDVSNNNGGSLTSYIPSILELFPTIASGTIQTFDHAVVMFLDVSGFTPLSERLSKQGSFGVELLRNVISEFFGDLIPVIENNNGIVLKFAGDALQVIWILKNDEDFEQIQTIVDVAHHIAKIVWSVEARKSKYHIPLEFNSNILHDLMLRVKVSLALGETHILIVGESSNDGRLELIVTGNPIKELAAAEHYQTTPSKVIVTPKIWKLISEFYDSVELAEGFREMVFSDDSKLKIVKTKKQSNVNPTLQSIANRFVPLPVVKFAGSVVPELRKITTMFILLDSEFTTDIKSFKLLNEATSIIVSLLKKHNGELRQAIVDDKGAVQIGVFGMPFLSNDKNAKQAVLCGMEIVDNLKSKISLKCAIGLSTGRAYLGNCGSTERCEYVALGDTVNLSARLMGFASKQFSNHNEEQIIQPKQEQTNSKIRTLRDIGPSSVTLARPPYPIILDQRTRKEIIDSDIVFQQLKSINVKGKSELIEIHQPITIQHKHIHSPKIQHKHTHAHEPQTDIRHGDCAGVFGRDSELKTLSEFYTNLHQSKKGGTILIEADAGFGKSALTRYFMSTIDLKIVDPQVLLFYQSASFEAQYITLNLAGKFFRTILKTLEEDYQLSLSSIFNESNPLFHYIPLLLDLPFLHLKNVQPNEATEKLPADVKIAKLALICGEILDALLKFNPIVLVIEDVQWLDSLSVQLFSILCRNMNSKQILFIFNARLQSSFRKELQQLQSTKFISLDRLKLEPIVQIIQNVVEVQKVDEKLANLIFEKSNGIPFFAREITLALFESSRAFVDVDGIAKLIASLGASGEESNVAIIVPDSIADVILYRVDLLPPPLSALLKCASVFGFYFEANDLLRSIYSFPNNLNEVLVALTDLSMILKRSENTYSFSHQIAQEVIYETITTSQKIAWHTTIAQNLENQSIENLVWFPIATHWKRAANLPKATLAFFKATEQSYEKNAFEDSLSLALECQKANSQSKVLECNQVTALDCMLASSYSLTGKGMVAFEITKKLLGEKFKHPYPTSDEQADKEAFEMMEKLEQFELVVDHAKNPPTKLQILVANVMFRVHFAVVGSEPSFANFRWFSVHSLMFCWEAGRESTAITMLGLLAFFFGPKGMKHARTEEQGKRIGLFKDRIYEHLKTRLPEKDISWGLLQSDAHVLHGSHKIKEAEEACFTFIANAPEPEQCVGLLANINTYKCDFEQALKYVDRYEEICKQDNRKVYVETATRIRSQIFILQGKLQISEQIDVMLSANSAVLGGMGLIFLGIRDLQRKLLTGKFFENVEKTVEMLKKHTQFFQMAKRILYMGLTFLYWAFSFHMEQLITLMTVYKSNEEYQKLVNVNFELMEALTDFWPFCFPLRHYFRVRYWRATDPSKSEEYLTSVLEEALELIGDFNPWMRAKILWELDRKEEAKSLATKFKFESNYLNVSHLYPPILEPTKSEIAIQQSINQKEEQEQEKRTELKKENGNEKSPHFPNLFGVGVALSIVIGGLYLFVKRK